MREKNIRVCNVWANAKDFKIFLKSTNMIPVKIIDIDMIYNIIQKLVRFFVLVIS